jgi:protein SCO1/2
MKPTSHPLIAFLALMTVALAITGGILWARGPTPQIVTSAPAIVGKTVTSGTAAIGGPFTLAATNGQTVGDRTFRGKWLLIYFGYTYCPDACPIALSNMSVALQRLGSDASKFQPLFITVDPQRDTRQVMADYLKSFDSRIIGLTGTQAQIDRVIKEYHLYVSRQKPDPSNGDYLVDHSAYIYLIDPQGKFVNVTEGSATGNTIAEWLRMKMAQADRKGALE